MATHSSVLAWKIPWTEEPGGLQSMRSQRVGHNWAHTHTHTHTHTHSLASVCHEIILFEQELASFKKVFANNKIIDIMFRNKVWLNMSQFVYKSGMKCRDAATGEPFSNLVFPLWQASPLSCKWFLSLVFSAASGEFPRYSRTWIQKGVEERLKEGTWQSNIWFSFCHSYYSHSLTSNHG